MSRGPSNYNCCCCCWDGVTERRGGEGHGLREIYPVSGPRNSPPVVTSGGHDTSQFGVNNNNNNNLIWFVFPHLTLSKGGPGNIPARAVLPSAASGAFIAWEGSPRHSAR